MELKEQIELENSTWDLEFQDWLLELNKRRITNKWDEINLNSKDCFFDISDRCWGDINGRFSIQYFELLKEIQNNDLQLYNKYKNRGIKILELFSFFSVSRSEYLKFKINHDKHI